MLAAAVLLALVATANLAVAGQPWGIVYGLGLWGAKAVQAPGADLNAGAYWAAPGNAGRLQDCLLLEVTPLTNIGLIVGALVVMRWRAPVAPQVARLRPARWLAVLAAGLVMGYSARVAFGCTVGAFFSGISTGRLHGWAWFAAAFLGSTLGVRLRPLLLHPAEPAPAAAGSAA